MSTSYSHSFESTASFDPVDPSILHIEECSRFACPYCRWNLEAILLLCFTGHDFENIIMIRLLVNNGKLYVMYISVDANNNEINQVQY